MTLLVCLPPKSKLPTQLKIGLIIFEYTSESPAVANATIAVDAVLDMCSNLPSEPVILSMFAKIIDIGPDAINDATPIAPPTAFS